MNILVSHCLLGQPCRYDAGARSHPDLLRLAQLGYRLIPVCPEVLGGLPTPRPPAELQADGRVLDREGRDVTLPYLEGARLALELARAHACTLAILKERSPSCGCGEIYDGTFSRRLVPGLGVTARLLSQHGVRVLGESQVSDYFHL